jgi:WD40 repeat protein
MGAGGAASIAGAPGLDFRRAAVAPRRRRGYTRGVIAELVSQRASRPIGIAAAVLAIVVLARPAAPPPALERTFRLGGHHEGTAVAMFSPDGTRVLSLGDRTAIVRDARGGRQHFQIDADPQDEMLWSADWSPDGERLATVTRHGTAMVWDARTGALLHRRATGTLADFIEFAPDGRLLTERVDGFELWSTDGTTLRLPAGPHPNEAAFSPDGRYLVSAADRRLQLWDTATGAELARVDHDDAVRSVRWLPRDRVAFVDGTSIAIWDVATRRTVRTIRPPEPPWYVVASPDAATVFVAAGEAPLVFAYDVASGDLRLTLAIDGELAQMALVPGGDRLVTCSGPLGGLADKTVQVWDAQTGAAIRTLGEPHRIASFALSRDGELIAANAEHDARVFALRTGEPRAVLGGHIAGVTAIGFAAGGRVFATASNRFLGDDHTAKLWDAQTGVLLGSVAHDSVVNSVAFAPDGRTFATTSNDWTIGVWDATTFGLVRATAHRGTVYAARYAPDGRAIVSASADGTARVWDAATGGQRLVVRSDDAMLDARFSPDGAAIATSDSRGVVAVWRVRDGARRFATHACDGWATAIDFDRDGRRVLASCGRTSAIVDATTGAVLHELAGDRAQLSPDGTRVLTTDPVHANVFDATTGARIAAIAIVDDPLRDFAAAWTPDGARLIAGDDHGELTLWDATTGAALAAVDARPGKVWELAFDPGDPTRLIVAGEDGHDQNATGALAVWRLVPTR